jgi:predicted DNA-binding protein YlxM (UPF0122 family)
MSDDAKQKTDTSRGLFSLSEFAERNGIARSTVYVEHERGRLIIRKLGRKSVILAEDEAQWRSGLPLLRTSRGQA